MFFFFRNRVLTYTFFEHLFCVRSWMINGVSLRGAGIAFLFETVYLNDVWARFFFLRAHVHARSRGPTTGIPVLPFF